LGIYGINISDVFREPNEARRWKKAENNIKSPLMRLLSVMTCPKVWQREVGNCHGNDLAVVSAKHSSRKNSIKAFN
jgi:hypothetical protein